MRAKCPAENALVTNSGGKKQESQTSEEARILSAVLEVYGKMRMGEKDLMEIFLVVFLLSTLCRTLTTWSWRRDSNICPGRNTSF